MLLSVLIYVIVGVFVGILAGWLGTGGGIVIVPVMLYFMTKAGLDHTLALHVAITTSLAFIMVNSLYTSIGHYRHGNLIKPLFFRLVIFVIIGAIVGSQLGQIMPSSWVKTVFTVVVCIVFVQSFLKRRKPSVTENAVEPSMPGTLSRAGAGFFIGLLSALIGIGGAIVTNPYLRHYHFPMKKSAAISIALAFPMALFALISLLTVSMHVSGILHYNIGYLYLPALFGLLFGSFIGSPLGIRLVKVVPDVWSLWLFRVVVLLVIIKML